jgi:PAS domain S-box-containing protein
MTTGLYQGDNHDTKQEPLTQREQKILFSPLRLVVVLVLCVFTTEFLVHYLLQNTSMFSPSRVILLDAVLLSVALCPVLIFLLFRPLKHLVARHQINENQLRRHKEHLEQEVKARTAELDSVVQQLREEIIEKKQLEKDKQDTYCTLHTTLESMNEGFVSLDRQWRYAYVNKAAAHLMGRDVAEMLGRVCWEVFPESVNSLAYREIHRSVTENCITFFDDFIVEPLNRWYEYRCYPSPEGVSIFITDITERKYAEARFRDLSEHLETVREQERLAISREIHDDIGQTLTAFKLDLSWIERKFPSGNNELIGRLNAMRSSLDLLITKAQNLASELRPPLLDNLGLAAAIDWQTREFKRRCGIECHLMLNEEIKALDKQTGTAIMRILQEALTNIARHARATEVSVSLCRSGTDDLILEISDNGAGISQEEISSPLAFGLMGMQERARLCHGQLTIKGVHGEGTTIRLEIPRGAVKEAV